MSEDGKKVTYLDAKDIIFLPPWARFGIMGILGTLAISACVAGLGFFFFADYRDKIMPVFSIAQTAAGGFAVIVFVLFSERQLSTARLHQKTDQFLEIFMRDTLAQIEIPQVKRGQTVHVNVEKREETVHRGRKDIYGANYRIFLENFTMKLWVGINVKRLIIIYFIKAEGPADAARLEDIFKFTFGGAAKVGYSTNFEYVESEGEKIVSVWSTVMADSAILGNPAEQLFWIQDVAMMTQSFIRTALRHGLQLDTKTEPGPL